MISGERKDFAKILDQHHAALMAEAIDKGVDEYFARYISHARTGHERFIAFMRGKRSSLEFSPAERLERRFSHAITDYQRTRQNSYDAILDPEALAEYATDHGQFIRHFIKGLPIINQARNSNREGLETWKRCLTLECRKSPRRIFELVSGLTTFAAEFPTRYNWQSLAEEQNPTMLPFEQFKTPLPEEASAGNCATKLAPSHSTLLTIPGVMGLGISSTLLYNREPALLPCRSRTALAALHFLSGEVTCGLETSEFICWNTYTNTCSTNHLYPYQAFYYHIARVAERLMEGASQLEVEFSTEYRMVLLHDFFQFVADENINKMEAWLPETPYGER